MTIPWSEADPPSIADVRAALQRISPHIHRTPVVSSRSLDELTSARLHFKCENLQRSGAFKVRGAFNAVMSLNDAQAARGVATHSSGNHGAALALAAAARGVTATVVVPESAAKVKLAAIARSGARIVRCASTLAAREQALSEVLRESGAYYIAPFDDPRIIAGQGTAALELLEQVAGLDQIWVPVGGGGLASGTAIVTSQWPACRTIGAEPKNADDAARSLASGKLEPMDAPDTIADGLRTSLSPLTLAVLIEAGVKIVLATEAEIRHAQRLLSERLKVRIEPSAAVPLAAMLAHPGLADGANVGVILSGGNVDLGVVGE